MENGKKKALWNGLYITIGFFSIIVVVMASNMLEILDGDNCPQTYALFVAMAREMHEGNFSAWNPYLWGGFPNVGNFITESVYPVNWLLCYLFYDHETAVVSYAVIPCNLIFHLEVYFLGMYFLLKKMSFSCLNAFSVCMTSTLCGALLSFRYWIVYFDGFCWIPFLLLAAILMFEAQKGDKLLYAVILGILFALEASISVAVMLVISVFLFGILFAVYLFKNAKEQIIYNTGYSILAGVLGILLSAPILLSTLTFMRYMVRFVPDIGYLTWGIKLPMEEYFKWTYPSQYFVQILNFQNISDLTTSISPFILLFGTVGIFCKRKENIRLYYISLIGAFLCALTCYGIVVPAILYYIPGLNQLREAIMYGIFLGMFSGIVAAQGFQLVEQAVERKAEKVDRMRIALFTILMTGLLGYNVLSGRVISIIFVVLAIIYILILFIKNARMRKCSFMVCTLVFVGLCVKDMYNAMDAYTYSEVEVIERVSQTCENAIEFKEYIDGLDPNDEYYRMTSWGHRPCYPENIASVIGFYDVKGYLNPSLASGINIHNILPLDKRAQLQNIKYYIANAEEDQGILNIFQQNDCYDKVGEVEEVYTDWGGVEKAAVYVYEALNNLGDAWIVSDYIWNDDYDQKEVLQMISSEDFRLDRTAVIDRCKLSETDERNIAEINPESGTVRDVCGVVSGKGIQYHINTEASGILVTAELYYPGWKVYVNGEERTILTVDGTNRGVVVPAGESDVEFRYSPWELQIGMVLHMGAVVLICILFFCVVRSKKFKVR